jgi:hypothetical protein
MERSVATAYQVRSGLPHRCFFNWQSQRGLIGEHLVLSVGRSLKY